MPHASATTEVPPSSSINLQANSFLVSMPRILGAPKLLCQGMPNCTGDRIAYMTPLIERAKILLDLAGGSVTALADIAGVKAPSVSDWLNGKTKTLKGAPAARISARFNLNPVWVSEGRGSMQGRETQPGDSRLPIKRGQFRLFAGVTGYEIDYDHGDGEPIFMARRWFEQNRYSPENLLALKVHGQSMEPSLYDGDLVIVNTANHTPRDGVVFAINYEGEMVIKRMRREAGQWMITSDNPNKIHYPDKVCADGCFVLGEVIYKQSERI